MTDEIDRLYMDTNALIALAEGSDALPGSLYELAGAQNAGEEFLFTSLLSLAELLVQPYKSRSDSLIDLYSDWLVDGGWLNVGPVDRDVLRYAAVVRSRHHAIKLPDAIHISTAIAFRCTHFLTGDKRLPEQIELRHERWGLIKGPAQLKIIPLDRRLVDEIVRKRYGQ